MYSAMIRLYWFMLYCLPEDGLVEFEYEHSMGSKIVFFIIEA